MRNVLLGLLLLSVESYKSGEAEQSNDKVVEVYQNLGAYLKQYW